MDLDSDVPNLTTPDEPVESVEMVVLLFAFCRPKFTMRVGDCTLLRGSPFDDTLFPFRDICN